MKNHKYNAVGCFIFAGGMTLGVREHFNVLAHLEESAYGTETAKHNLKIPIYYPVDSWPRFIRQNRGDVDFVYGNPPCAPWSALGRHRWRDDGRLQCVANLFGVLRDLRPTVWAWESVTQAYSTGRDLVERYTREALMMGYSVTWFLHDTMYCVPVAQSRKRFFMLAHKVSLPWRKPPFDRPLSIREALRGIKPQLTEKEKKFFANILPYVEPGESVLDGWYKMKKLGLVVHKRNKLGQVIGRPNFDAYRCDPDKPIGAVTGGFRGHWKQNRPLAINELAHLCGFPQWWEWKTSNSGRFGELARGVIPPMGEYLARIVKDGLDRGERERGHVWLVDFRRSPGQISWMPRGELLRA